MQTPAGQTALITGAGDGLGRAIARRLNEAGMRVVLVGRTMEKLEESASSMEGSVRVERCDTSDPGSVEELAAQLGQEKISVLVNNAGVAGPVSPLVDIDPTAWDEVFAVNVRGVFLMCKSFIPPMVARGHGQVINLASVSGKRPLANRTPYTASKMAVIGLTATLAFEVGPLGVMVNSLSPGPVDGPRMKRNFTLEAERSGQTIEEVAKSFTSRAALGRMVTEQEVAEAALAMLSMSGLCGADVDLSAGMVAR